jgi:hypothetical protein
MKNREDLERLRKAHLVLADSEQWGKYLKEFSPEQTGMVEMLKGDFREGIKHCAIFTLLLTSSHDLRDLWDYNPGIFPDYPYAGKFIKELPLSEETLRFTARLLVDLCAMMRREKDRVEKSQEKFGIYTHYQLQLLTKLGGDAADRVFSDLMQSIKVLHCRREGIQYPQDGYLLFGRILRFPGLDPCWKRRADARMREIVLAELAIRASGQEKHTSFPAPELYLRRIFEHGDTDSDKALLKEQIRFVLDIGDKLKLHKGSFKLFWILYVLDLFNGESDASEDIRFVRLAERSGIFSHIAEEDGSYPRQIVQAIPPAGNEELIENISRHIADSEARLQEVRRQREISFTEHCAKKAAILAAMK